MKASGTGSPVWFKCHVDRSRNKRAKGSRSSDRSREYVCSCGHVGWSNHVDLARMAGEPSNTNHPEWG